MPLDKDGGKTFFDDDDKSPSQTCRRKDHTRFSFLPPAFAGTETEFALDAADRSDLKAEIGCNDRGVYSLCPLHRFFVAANEMGLSVGVEVWCVYLSVNEHGEPPRIIVARNSRAAIAGRFMLSSFYHAN
jgi:hypothetical protein